MKFTIEDISKYYDYKRKSYNQKYNLGYYTHIHTGFYSPQDFPILHRDGIDLQGLGMKLIKHLLFVGQENLTRHACSSLSNRGCRNVMDCGCGHGGTSIYLAQNHNIHVVAITVSQEQVLQTKHFVRMAGVENLVETRLMNVFDAYLGDAAFDGIVSIDSFCQIGNFKTLLPVLSKIMRQGGVLVVCDNFIDKRAKDFKRRFDSYWRSDISTLQDLLDVAVAQEFIVKDVTDQTITQIPFWKLSGTHSKLLLMSKKIENNQAERQRLVQSLSFHNDLLHAFLDGDMYYYSLVLQKR